MKSFYPILVSAFVISFPFFGLNAQENSAAASDSQSIEEGKSSPWHTSYATAVTEAKVSGKKLFIVFTGKEWIDICRAFDSDILSQPVFIDLVSPQFALLNLEYPKDNMLPREEAAEKALLKDAYRVRGFPTVVLTEVDGRPFGVNGFQPIPAEEYAKQILEVDSIHDEALALRTEAMTFDGVQKATRLSESIPDLPGNLKARYYIKEMEAVLENDPEDVLKLKKEYSLLIADVEYSKKMELLARSSQWAEMEALTDQYIDANNLEGGALQAALLNKAGVQGNQQMSEAQIETLKRTIVINAESQQGAVAKQMLTEIENKAAEAQEEDQKKTE